MSLDESAIELLECFGWDPFDVERHNIDVPDGFIVLVHERTGLWISRIEDVNDALAAWDYDECITYAGVELDHLTRLFDLAVPGVRWFETSRYADTQTPTPAPVDDGYPLDDIPF